MRARTEGWSTIGAGFVFLGERTLPFAAYSGAWIPVLGQLLTCCVTLPKSLNLPRTSLVKWVSDNLRVGARIKRECLERFPSKVPSRKSSRSVGCNYPLLSPHWVPWPLSGGSARCFLPRD